MTLRYAMALAVWVAPLFGANPAAAAVPVVAAAPEVQQKVYAVTINGETVSQGTVVLVEPGGSVLVAGEDLQQWRFIIAGKTPRSVNDGRPYFALSDFPGLTVRIDEAREILNISAPGELFSLTKVENLYDSGGHRIINRSPGAFLNYEFSGARFSGTSFEQGIFETGVSGTRGGVLTSSFGWTPNAHGSHFSRLTTTWEQSFVEAHSRLRIGDAVSSPGRLGGSVALAGVQYASDFATDPEFATSADLYVRGIAPSASTVDVLVNNVPYITGERVPTGPFVLQAPAFGLDGQGRITLVVHDALGNAHIITQSFYGSRQVLKSGVSEFSYEAGLQRQDFAAFGLSAYSKPVAAGTIRHGFTNSVTGEAHVEAAPGVEMAEFTTDMAVPGIGLISAGVATSFTPLGTGVRALLGAQFQAHSGFGLSAQVTGSSSSFKTIGPTTTSGMSEQVFATVPLRGLFLSGGYVAAQQSGRTSSFATFGLGGRIAGGSMNISVSEGLNGAPSSYYAGFATRIGHASVNTTASSTRMSTLVQSDAPPSGYGSTTGISINKEPGSSAFVGATYGFDSPVVHFDGTADRDSMLANVRGGIMLVGGKLSVARELVGSYGIAVVPGYPNVRVSVNGLEVGRTDRNGVVALPFLVPYNVNRITIDQDDLPISANFASLVQTTIPYFRSATIVRFNTGVGGGVIVHLKLPNGTFIPAGSEVQGAKGVANYPIGDEGMAFLPALPLGKAGFVTRIAGDGTCSFTIDVPRDTSDIPDLGSVTCGAVNVATPAPSAAPAAANPESPLTSIPQPVASPQIVKPSPHPET